MTLTRDQILALKPSVSEPIPVPELGGSVCLRVMDGKQREKFEQVYLAEGRTDIRATLLAFTVSDEKGGLVFSEADVPLINSLPAPVVKRLYDASTRLNAVTQEQVDELAGN